MIRQALLAFGDFSRMPQSANSVEQVRGPAHAALLLYEEYSFVKASRRDFGLGRISLVPCIGQTYSARSTVIEVV